jgi:alkylation response protein AidB-like acyl-CoA dehydrogenase
VTTETDDTEAEAALRREVRAWMEEHASRFGPTKRGPRMADNADEVAASRAWLAELDDGGWAVPNWPVAFGGRGFGSNEMRIVREETYRFAVPDNLSSVGLQMVAPTLMVHGTPEQQAAFLDPMRRGEHIWCQLFSEPDAGSDLASLRTKADCARRPSPTATAGSSTARRCGPAARSTRTGRSCLPGPSPVRSATAASRTSWST